ncbi:MAG: DUF4099 domain-containing protein [Bacilli bacterium]
MLLKIEEIPWDELSRIGITRERLEKTNNLEKLLNFEKTTLLSLWGNVNGYELKGDGKLALTKSSDGKIHIKMQFVKKYPELNLPIYGTYLNTHQKKNILETGHAGSPITIQKQDGTTIKMLVSLDKQTKQLECIALDKVRIRETVAGITLSVTEKDTLKNGGVVFIKDMTKKDGTLFSSLVIYDADRHDITFIKPKQEQQAEKQEQEQKQEQKKKKNVKQSV